MSIRSPARLFALPDRLPNIHVGQPLLLSLSQTLGWWVDGAVGSVHGTRANTTASQSKCSLKMRIPFVLTSSPVFMDRRDNKPRALFIGNFSRPHREFFIRYRSYGHCSSFRVQQHWFYRRLILGHLNDNVSSNCSFRHTYVHNRFCTRFFQGLLVAFCNWM